MKKITVTTNLNEEDRKSFEIIANDWGIKPGLVLRRLITVLIQEKINFLEIVKQSSNINNSDCKEKLLRVSLSADEKKKLVAISEEWDFTVSAVLRRLVRAFNLGIISKNEIW